MAPWKPSLGLLNTAMKNAIENSGLDKHEIDGIVSRGVNGMRTRVTCPQQARTLYALRRARYNWPRTPLIGHV